MGKVENITRRRFLVTSAVFGGGMALGVAPGEADAAFANVNPWGAEAVTGAEFTPWISIGPDDIVTVRVATPEIGNGVMTQAAMNVAEELQCDWSKVKAEFAPTGRDYRENSVYSKAVGGLAYFSGRSTERTRMTQYLQVGASARERLKAAAAAEWKVPVTEIAAKDSVLTHTPTGRTLRYGEIAAKAATVSLAAEPALKPQSEWSFLGKATPAKLNLPLIVNGSAIYGMDVRLPNMAYAALRQSPVHGGKLKSYDADAVKHMPGVLAVVVVDPSEKRGSPVKLNAPFPLDASTAQSAVAVIAEHYWQARKALDALPVEWDAGPGGHWKTTEQMYQSAIADLDREQAHEGEKIDKNVGDVAVLGAQKKQVEGVYLTPYCEHACMEPLNGTALVTQDGVELWHPSQHSQLAFTVAADEAGVSPDNVTFHQTFVGGGFGRRVMGNDVRMVVAVAKKFPGRPVHVIWSREEMTRQGRYRPMVAVKLKAGLDGTGMPKALMARIASTDTNPRGMSDGPYANGGIPNVRFESRKPAIHLMTGPYRGPAYNSNSFILETFIDECAHEAGIDPVEYRMKLLANWPDKGWTMCLKEAADKSGWGKSLPKGMGQGVAISNWGADGKPQSGTTVCVVATVEVTRKGNLKVHELDVAFDTGRIVNRDAIETEIQGGLIFGLNMTLNEELTVKDGRVVEGNYDQYPMLRIADTPPKINIHFGGLSGHDRFTESGEPPAGPVGPAVGNAIFRATGKRIRSTPFRKHDLSWA